MDSFRSRLLVRRARLLAPLAFALVACGVAAQQDVSNFPSAAMGFLGQELPQMEKAVADRDRDYFEAAMNRMLDFSDSWGFKSHDNPALANYAACTEPVSDFLVVGLCRIMTTADGCEPGLAARFNGNLQKCRALAAGR
jgi:hypothetical protein